MPNWCQNVMYIKNATPKLREAIEDGRLCDFIKPMPKELEDTTSPSDGLNWYDWRVENWGTKWDINVPIVQDDEDDTLVVTFDTAWGPPCEMWREMSKKFDFEAYFVEYGMMFFGSFIEGTEWSQEFPNGRYAPEDSDDYHGWVHPNAYLQNVYS